MSMGMTKYLNKIELCKFNAVGRENDPQGEWEETVGDQSNDGPWTLAVGRGDMSFMAGKVLGTLAFAQAKQEVTSVHFRFYVAPLLCLTKKLLYTWVSGYFVALVAQMICISLSRVDRGTSCSSVTRESFCSWNWAMVKWFLDLVMICSLGAYWTMCQLLCSSLVLTLCY